MEELLCLGDAPGGKGGGAGLLVHHVIGVQVGILLLHGVNLRYEVHSPLKNLLLIPLIAQIYIQQDNLMPAFLKRMINHHP